MILTSEQLHEIERVLVIVAHPDDIESWAAGTVCRFVDAGKQAAFVLVTSGDKGTSDPVLTSQQVGAIREVEQVEAARIMGVEAVTFLRWPDSEVEPTLTLRRELVRQARRHRPDLLITHDPVPPYRLHPDHRAVGRAALDAIFPCARDALIFPEQIREEGLSAHIVPEAWLFATESPDVWVDISTTLMRKIAARLAHRSQFGDAQELQSNWYRRAAEQGLAPAQYQLGLRYAKGDGVTKDFAAAVGWYRRAAQQGVAFAQFNLGVRYANGQGVERDVVLAYVWFSLAAQGLLGEEADVARRARDSIRNTLSPEQLTRGDRMVSTWKPTAEKPGGAPSRTN